MESKGELRKHINTFFNPKRLCRVHYLKWVLTDPDWSIRYFWVFDTKSEYARSWVLKSHSRKAYIVLSQSEALDFIRYRGTHNNPIEIHGVYAKGKYHKQIIEH